MVRKIRCEVCKFELIEYYDSYICDEDRKGYICDDCATREEDEVVEVLNDNEKS